MAKKSFKPSHVELRHKTYYATLTIPKDVRHLLKKIRFFKSTQTSNLKQAELKAANLVFKWNQQIEKARALIRADSDDPNIVSAMGLFQELQTNLNPDIVMDVIEEERYKIQFQVSEADAEVFASIAKGERRYLKSIEPEWINNEKSAGLKQKTIDQMAKDIKLINQYFPTADFFNSKNIEIFLNYLGNDRGKSASSIKRITNAGRNFFRYLQKIKEIPSDLPNPFKIPDDFRKST